MAQEKAEPLTCVCDRLPEPSRPCFYHRTLRSAGESRNFVESGIRFAMPEAVKKRDREEILEEERLKIQKREASKRRSQSKRR